MKRINIALCLLIGCIHSYSFSLGENRLEEKLLLIRETYHENPIESLDKLDSLISLDNLSDNTLGDLHYTKGQIIYKVLKENDRALLTFYKALKYFRNTKNENKQYSALTYIGNTFNNLYKYDYAKEYFEEISNLKIDNRDNYLYARYHLAKTLRLNKEYNSAISIQEKLLTEFKKNDALIDRLDCHLELGLSFIKTNNWVEAQKHYNEVLELVKNSTKDHDYDRISAKALLSLGFVELQNGNLKSARNYLAQSLPVFESAEDHFHTIINYKNLGLVALAENDQESAINYFKESVALKDHNTNLNEVTNSLNELIDIYQQRGDLRKSFIYSQQLNELTLPLIELNNKLEKLHARYQAENVHHIIEKYELEASLSSARNRNIIIACILICLAFASIAGYVWFKKRQRVDDSLIQFLKDKHHVLISMGGKLGMDMDEMERYTKKGTN